MKKKSRGRLAYEYYMENDVTKIQACNEFNLSCNAINILTYIKGGK